MKTKRLSWAKQYESWTSDDWANVVFSDESKFNLFGPDGKQYVRRRTGERYSESCILPTIKHSAYVMAWGAITKYGVGHLILLTRTVNADEYKKIIVGGLIPTIEQLSEFADEVTFQDDSAPCHRARLVNSFKDELGIKSLPWPGNSPDMNPIENLWYEMGKKIKEMRPKTILELKIIMEDVWFNKITPKYLENLLNSMPRRLQAVIKAKGGATKY